MVIRQNVLLLVNGQPAKAASFQNAKNYQWITLKDNLDMSVSIRLEIELIRRVKRNLGQFARSFVGTAGEMLLES